MADIKLTLVVACALVDADKRVLIAQRPEGKALAGLWEFPGGKVEPGERPEQTLIRELHEEIGIDVSEPCLAPLTFRAPRHTSGRFLPTRVSCSASGRLTCGVSSSSCWTGALRADILSRARNTARSRPGYAVQRPATDTSM